MPALFTAMSRDPNLSTAAWTAASMLLDWLTSHWTESTSLPVCSRMKAAVSSPVNDCSSATTTLAPACDRQRAVALPIPLPAPVTRATLPWRIGRVVILTGYEGLIGACTRVACGVVEKRMPVDRPFELHWQPSAGRVFERLTEDSASRPVGLIVHNILSIRVCKRRSSEFHGHNLHASTCTMNPQQS